MHSSETGGAAPATGSSLLLQLGKLIIRARSTSPAGGRAPPEPAHYSTKLLPSTSQQVRIYSLQVTFSLWETRGRWSVAGPDENSLLFEL